MEWHLENGVQHKKKCGVLKFGHCCVRPIFTCKLDNEEIKVKSEEKHLGITVTDKQTPEVHISKKTDEIYNLVRNKSSIQLSRSRDD